MAETQQNALKKLNRLRRVQQDEGADVRKRVKAAQANIADAIRKAAKNPKAATSARFRNSFYGAVSSHYELMADELDAWAQDLSENLSEEWHGRIKHEARALSASVSSPPLVAQALKFNRKRAQRYFEILNPDNSSQLAATFTRQMAPSTISGLRQSLIDTVRQANIEGLTHREQHKLLQSKWDKLAGDLNDQRFIDARGRKWDNSTYLNMLVRTTSSRITRETTLDTITDNGDDLARVHAIGDNCPICRRWDGIIFSVTGNTPKFPAYSDVLAAGMFHPNCDCLTERVIPEIESDEIKAQAAVETPKDWTDPKAVDAYSEKLPKPPNAYHPANYEAKREHIKGLQQKLRDTSGTGSREARKALKAEIEQQGDELDQMATILQDGGAVPPELLAPTAKGAKIEQLSAAQARKAKPDEPKAIDTPAPAAFVPAKTVKEAEEWARNNIVPEPYKIEEYIDRKTREVVERREVSNVSYKGLKLEAANEVNTALDRAKKAGLPLPKTVITKNFRTQGFNMRVKGRDIEINSKFMKDAKTVKEASDKLEAKALEARELLPKLREANAAGKLDNKGQGFLAFAESVTKYDRQSVTTTIDEITTHELGHLLDFEGYNVAKVDRETWREMVRESSFEMMQEPRRYRLSSYPEQERLFGAERQETFAESFAAYIKGEREETLGPKTLTLFKGLGL